MSGAVSADMMTADVLTATRGISTSTKGNRTTTQLASLTLIPSCVRYVCAVQESDGRVAQLLISLKSPTEWVHVLRVLCEGRVLQTPAVTNSGLGAIENLCQRYPEIHSPPVTSDLAPRNKCRSSWPSEEQKV